MEKQLCISTPVDLNLSRRENSHIGHKVKEYLYLGNCGRLPVSHPITSSIFTGGILICIFNQQVKDTIIENN